MHLFRQAQHAGLLAVILLFTSLSAAVPAHAQEKDLFIQLRGNWGGGGIMHLSEGRKSRITCDAKYSGTATQLVIAIHCKSDFQDIDLRARLSKNMGRLSGTWEEKSYSAIGAITGAAQPSRLNFMIGGGVAGRMTVNYSSRKQQVTIQTAGIPLEKIEINMSRR